MRLMILAAVALLAGLGLPAVASTLGPDHGGQPPFRPADPLQFPPTPPNDRCVTQGAAFAHSSLVVLRSVPQPGLRRARARADGGPPGRAGFGRSQRLGRMFAALAAPECDRRGPPPDVTGPGTPPPLTSATLPASAASLMPALMLLTVYARLRRRNSGGGRGPERARASM
jgi:hypothetical protein